MRLYKDDPEPFITLFIQIISPFLLILYGALIIKFALIIIDLLF